MNVDEIMVIKNSNQCTTTITTTDQIHYIENIREYDQKKVKLDHSSATLLNYRNNKTLINTKKKSNKIITHMQRFKFKYQNEQE